MSEEQGNREVPITIFYSCAQEDEALCRELEKHLGLLRWEGKIVAWSKREILAGGNWIDETDQRLLSASLILLLISPDFLNSEYVHGTEVHRALERHSQGATRVIPILLRPSGWRHTPLAHLKCLPVNAQPVITWQHKDEAFQEIADEIRRIIELLWLPTKKIPSYLPHLPSDNTDRAFSEKAPFALSSVASGQFLFKYDLHSDTPMTVSWSPDGTRIASGGLDNAVHIWEASTGQHLLIYRHPRTFVLLAVNVVRWSPDSKYIASAGSNSSNIYVWDATNKQLISTYHHLFSTRPPGRIFSLAWSPDGNFIASANLMMFQALAHIWGALNGKSIMKIARADMLKGDFPGHVAWSSDGSRIIANLEKRLYIYHAVTGKHLLTFQEHTSMICDVIWSPDNQWIVSAQREKIIVWNAITGTILLSYQRHTSSIGRIAISPSGKYVASASEDRTVHIWETLTGLTHVIYKGHHDHVTSVTWSPDGTRIASASKDKSIHVWRTLLPE